MPDFGQFEAWQLTAVGCIAIMAFISMIMNGIWFRNILHKKLDLFILSVSIMDTTRSIIEFTLNTVHFVNKRYSTQVIGCNIQGYADNALSAISILSFLCVSFDPMIIVIFRKSAITTRMKIIMLANIWIGSLVVSTLPFWTGEGFVRHSSGIYCMIDLQSTSYSSLLIAILDIVGLIVTPGIILCIFIMVYNKLKIAVESDAVCSETAQELQLLLVKKGILMSCSHTIAWSFTVILFIYQYVTSLEAPYWMDVTATATSVLALSFNPLIFFLLDRKIFGSSFSYTKRCTKDQPKDTIIITKPIENPLKTRLASGPPLSTQS
ncbi:hypothetical protein HDV04_001961 [Boothiomyces sp. JEL0838]|nr:hypothetical protein HDV04_001961 [Boothiomyces sp. JEL0838]